VQSTGKHKLNYCLIKTSDLFYFLKVKYLGVAKATKFFIYASNCLGVSRIGAMLRAPFAMTPAFTCFSQLPSDWRDTFVIVGSWAKRNLFKISKMYFFHSWNIVVLFSCGGGAK